MPSNSNPLIHTTSYEVHTSVYEGPLDLLLHLIERAELDITRLSLANVTDQYLAYLQSLQETDAEEVSAFLVIAARLIQIKSEMLLPRPIIREEGQEDLGEALARQLRIYKTFKTVGIWLANRESSGYKSYLRLAQPPHIESNLDLSGITLNDLIDSIYSVLVQQDLRTELSTVVSAPKVTIREKISHITRILHESRHSSFRFFLPDQPSRLDIVVTFLAMLELIKRAAISVRQDLLFGDIEVETSSSWNENDVFELEFGE